MADDGQGGAGTAAERREADAIVARHASQLGQVTDREFAAVHGVSVEDVERWRSEHGAPRRATVPRKASGAAAPPAAPKRKAASSKAAKARKRPEPAVEPPPSPEEPLPPEPGEGVRGSRLDPFRELVGVLPDREVAERAGVTRSLVHAYRKKHGIPSPAAAVPASSASSAPPRPRAEPAPAAPPSAPAARPSRSSRLASFVDRMGHVSDGAIAKLAGVSRAAVRAYRDRRGIAPSVPRPAWAGAGRSEGEVAKEHPKKGRSKIDAVADLVGKLTDGEVGAKVGVSAGAVRLYRVARGIAPAVPQGHHAPPAAPPSAPPSAPSLPSAAPPTAVPERAGRKPRAARAVKAPAAPAPAAPAPAPAAPPAAPARSGGAWAWRVHVAGKGGDLVRYVVAADARAACDAAGALGDVTQIERVGQAL